MKNKTNTKTLPSMRVSEEINSLLLASLKKMNSGKFLKISLQDLRRYCYFDAGQRILKGEKLKSLEGGKEKQ